MLRTVQGWYGGWRRAGPDEPVSPAPVLDVAIPAEPGPRHPPTHQPPLARRHAATQRRRCRRQ